MMLNKRYYLGDAIHYLYIRRDAYNNGLFRQILAHQSRDTQGDFEQEVYNERWDGRSITKLLEYFEAKILLNEPKKMPLGRVFGRPEVGASWELIDDDQSPEDLP